MAEVDWLDERIAEGRRIALSDEPSPIRLSAWLDADLYRDSQRQRCERAGCCEACGPNELIDRADGQVICRRTYRPCRKQELAAIVSLYESVFQ